MLKTIIIGIVVTVVGLFALTAVNKVANRSNNSVNGYQTSEVADENSSKVAISGEINHPGEYYISTEKTLADLIDLAGGTTSLADPSAYNETTVISTHTSFYIAPLSTSSGLCVDTAVDKTNINTATATKLQEAGFNQNQAANIVDYRTSNGLFETLEEIMNVKGIGQATFEKMKNKICLS